MRNVGDTRKKKSWPIKQVDSGVDEDASPTEAAMGEPDLRVESEGDVGLVLSG
jgi:hypothetical protein